MRRVPLNHDSGDSADTAVGINGDVVRSGFPCRVYIGFAPTGECATVGAVAELSEAIGHGSSMTPQYRVVK